MGTDDAVILSACRTPIGTFGGQFKDVSAVELGTLVVREALTRAGVAPDAVDEVILGCILQAGLGMNPARQAAIHALAGPRPNGFAEPLRVPVAA